MTTTTATRNETITARAENGEDLAKIAAEYGVSRERIRQIVNATSTTSNDNIRAARAAARAARAAAREQAKKDRIVETAEANPDATINALVTLTGYDASTVRAALPWTERERRADAQNYTSTADTEILDAIRAAASLPGGKPLSGSFYDTHRTGGVSRARVLQRFETWTAACAAAGVESCKPNPSRVYTRNWTTEQMLAYAWNYLNADPSPTYAGFDVWLRDNEGAPSAQTIRNAIGGWNEIKRNAIESHSVTV